MASLIVDRFFLLSRITAISMAVFACLRLWLLYDCWGEISLEPTITILSTMLVGAVYDMAFVFYLNIPLVLILWLVPQKFDQRIGFKILVDVLYIIILFVLFITVAAELLFWDEFSVRFNFISVDYLIYSHEVSQNIMQSYPVAKIMIGISCLVAVTFAFFKPRATVSLKHAG